MFRFLPTIALVVCALATQAQPGSGGPTPAPPAMDAPIDGGISLLAASGVAYGLNKLRQRRRR
ncbi:MAG: PID-CTERM protein-sorting domain-containing protein [Janthinobacterium lividum]